MTHIDEVGGIPVGAFITTNESYEAIKCGLATLKENFNFSFYGQEFPSVVMMDDAAAQKKAIRSIWPQSTILLCSFHVAQAYWRWLMKKEHEVAITDRDNQMKLFQLAMYATDKADFASVINFLIALSPSITKSVLLR